MNIDASVVLDAMPAFAEKLVSLIEPDDIILLIGPLGAGKTTLVRAVAELLNADSEAASPTFTILNEYMVTFRGERMPLRHVDVYRLSGDDAFDSIGLRESIAIRGITFIEWGDTIRHILPPCVELTIDIVSMEERRMSLVIPERK